MSDAADREEVAANCRFCGYQCGLTATVDGGRVVGVRPDIGRYPYDKKISYGCPRWPNIPAIMDHPGRVNYPLRRKGERGGGQWERISWERAIEEIADRLTVLKDKFGPQTLATHIGGPHTTYWPLHRFMTLFGSPNNMGIGQICWNPGILAKSITFGWPAEMELEPEKTGCCLLWGTNPAESDNCLLWHTLLEYRKKGKPLIVIDPRKTQTAALATHWLPVRPGADAYLALGLLHVIVGEKIFDVRFVDRWCNGFEYLRYHVRQYTPDFVSQITGIDAALIVEAARLYALNPPASLHSGRGIDQIGPDSFPTHRAISILTALTGNLDAEGASHLCDMPDYTPELDLELSERMTGSVKEHQLGVRENGGKLILQTYKGYERIRIDTMKHGKRLPMRYLTSAHPNLVWKAMLSGDPYKISALIVMGSNPLLTQANTKLIYSALKSLDLMVVLEQFITPTAMLADYILPSAGVMERPVLETKAGTANIAYGGDAAVEPYYERRADYYFWRGIGLRLGQAVSDWPWGSYRDALIDSMSPTGMGWDEFCYWGFYDRPKLYRKYAGISKKTGRPIGFSTASGKVELYSGLLEEFGCSPLPAPHPPPETNQKFPLLLISGARFQPYFASSFHQITKFREIHPKPLAEISPETANELGLTDGDLVYVETEVGKACFTVKLAQMRDGVVSVEYGWWQPELSAAEPDLGGLWPSNANMLTSGDYDTSDSLLGTWRYNGIPCKITSVQDTDAQREL